MNQDISRGPAILPDPSNGIERPYPETKVGLPGRWLMLTRAAWLTLALLCLGLYLASVPPLFVALQTPCVGPLCLDWQLSSQQITSLHARGISLTLYASYFTALGLVIAIIHAGVAALIFWRKSADWLALFGSLALLIFGVVGMNDVATAALVKNSPSWRLPVAGLTVLGDIGVMTFFWLFPDGRFVPRWTRWLALGWAIFRLPAVFFPLSPFDKETGPLTGIAWPIFLGGIIVAQVYRYRHVSSPTQRQQTKWVVFGLTLAIGGFLGIVFGLPLLFPSLLVDLSSPSTWAAITTVAFLWLLVPLSIGVAILHYRLWDIDLVINRTLVYGALTASVIGLYILIVGGLGALFQTSGSLLVSLIATAIVAILFVPLRDRLQRGLNRLLYGQRDEPYLVLSRLGQRLEATLAPDAVLLTIVNTVKEALKLPYTAITLDQESPQPMAAAVGSPTPNLLCLPLSYQGEAIGQLILAPRGPGEEFNPAERRLLTDLAHQAGIAVAAVRLTADLQRSRERLVTAREEERRRLRRDLHDGLGPALAAHTLKIGSVRALLTRNIPAADALLAELETDIQTSLSDIRRLVYNLRPPSLDELGLIGAIRESATNLGFWSADFEWDRQNHIQDRTPKSKTENRNSGKGALGEIQKGLYLAIEAPERLPPLPAAVEVAAYRIVQEALTNVVRHAQARHCTIKLTVTADDRAQTADIFKPSAVGGQRSSLSSLSLELTDDGIGLPAERRAGVGLASMRERAQELGGTCQIETMPGGGVRVAAQLPLPIREE
jgi:signal transduction histidine kinase